jgi:hypothetical protein
VGCTPRSHRRVAGLGCHRGRPVKRMRRRGGGRGADRTH